MYIKIANLSDGDHFFDFDENVSVIGLEKPFFGNFKAEIKLTKSHSQIILDAQLELQANFECDRCTTNYDAILKTGYKLVYFFSKNLLNEESDDIIYLNPEADVINIAKEVRDYALLAVPMKKLCFEECKGLCRNCGKDLNKGECECSGKEIDPRWEPLLKIKKTINNN